jgi:hypothetical protein
MKTGRLLKFRRPGGDVHAYLYEEAGAVRASVYVLAPGQDRLPVHEVSGADSEAVEAEVRAWVQAHFPRPS